MQGRDMLWGGGVALALVLGMGWLVWPDTGSADYRLALGTVVRSVDCGSPEARDALRLELLDGRVLSAQLDGCGNRTGEVLSVEVPDPLPAGEVVARLTGTGVPAAAAAAQRLSALGVVIAGIAGALL
ncbi:MAG: hypothetical protein ACRDTC_08630, partial [Pseudonocardiaceae bacterium]